MKTYRIAGWDELYENSNSRKIKDLKFVPVRNKHDGEGYNKIVKHADGIAIFTGWILILQVASKCEPRGTLIKDNGKAHDSESLSDKTRVKPEIFDKAIPVLLEIEWLEMTVSQDTENKEVIEISQDSGKISQQGGKVSENSGVEGNRIELNLNESNRIEEDTPDLIRPADDGRDDSSAESEKDTPKDPLPDLRKGNTTWLTPFFDIWRNKYDAGLPVGRVSKPLKRLCAEHDNIKVAKAFARYINQVESPFHNFNKFADTFGEWTKTPKPASAVGLTDEQWEAQCEGMEGETTNV